MKLNKKFAEHAKLKRSPLKKLKEALLDMEADLKAHPLPSDRYHTIALAVNTACSLNLCTKEEIVDSCLVGGWRRDRSLNDNLSFAMGNSKSVVQFLLGRTNKAIRVVKSSERYNPSPYDRLPDGFMGWRQFTIT